MSLARGSHVAELLPDGRVLLAGNDGFTTHAEVFDAVAESLSATGALNVGRCYGCGATALQDGRILVAGGWNRGPVLNSVEIYDQSSGVFQFTGDMVDNRLAPNVHLLPDGRVLAFGGHTGFTPRFSAELFDPLTASWSTTGSMSVPRLGVSVMLADGRVMAIGGLTNTGAFLKSAEIYDPSTGAFVPTGGMSEGRHGHTATRLLDGRVLVVGGLAIALGAPEPALSSAEVYDPATGQFTPVGNMSVGRVGAVSILLSDGRIIIAGGSDPASMPLASTELFDPSTSTFSSGPFMVTPRSSPGVTRLLDGRVLLSGGYGVNSGRLATMEVFAPCSGDRDQPVISVPENLTIEALSPAGAPVTFAASAHDAVDGSVPVNCTSHSGATFPLGSTVVTCTATDAAGNTGSAAFTITVVDTAPPAIASVTPSQALLWSPNHKMTPITLAVDATDAASALSCRVISVSSNEAVDGTGDGDIAPDWEITGPLTVNLRAERSGNGGGRVYTITVECRDSFDNGAFATATVSVPRDMRR